MLHIAAGVLIGLLALWRLSLPQVAPPLALDGDCLVEWGGAQRWLSATLPASMVRDAAAARRLHGV